MWWTRDVDAPRDDRPEHQDERDAETPREVGSPQARRLDEREDGEDGAVCDRVALARERRGAEQSGERKRAGRLLHEPEPEEQRRGDEEHAERQIAGRGERELARHRQPEDEREPGEKRQQRQPRPEHEPDDEGEAGEQHGVEKRRVLDVPARAVHHCGDEGRDAERVLAMHGRRDRLHGEGAVVERAEDPAAVAVHELRLEHPDRVRVVAS